MPGHPCGEPRFGALGIWSTEILEEEIPVTVTLDAAYHPNHIDPEPREDPKSRSPNSGLRYSYGPDFRTLGWISLDPPRDLGIGLLQWGV